MSSPRNLSELTVEFAEDISGYAKKAVHVVREMESMGYSREQSVELAKITAVLKLEESVKGLEESIREKTDRR